jgi:hypothetical protein
MLFAWHRLAFSVSSVDRFQEHGTHGLRTQYRAAAGAACPVTMAAFLGFVASILVDERRTALALFLRAALAAFVGFATNLALPRASARGRSRLVTVAPPTLATRTSPSTRESSSTGSCQPRAGCRDASPTHHRRRATRRRLLERSHCGTRRRYGPCVSISTALLPHRRPLGNH